MTTWLVDTWSLATWQSPPSPGASSETPWWSLDTSHSIFCHFTWARSEHSGHLPLGFHPLIYLKHILYRIIDVIICVVIRCSLYRQNLFSESEFHDTCSLCGYYIYNSTTVIAKIKEMLRSLFYDILYYITMDYEKRYTPLLLAQCEKICAFETQNHVNYM